jgi:hypothetical protein
MRETVGYARVLLGGNGILLEHNVGRFVAAAEAIYSYEGTREMNIRRHRSAGRAEQHQSAPDCQAGEAGVEGGLAHAVVDGGYACGLFPAETR